MEGTFLKILPCWIERTKVQPRVLRSGVYEMHFLLSWVASM